MPLPGVDGVVGALFGLTSDAVVLLQGDEVRGWNPAAERMFGVPAAEALAGGARPLGAALARLQAVPLHGPPVRLSLPPHGTVDAVRHHSDGTDVLLLRDVSVQVRREHGLRRLAELGSALLGAEQSVAAVLQELCDVARELTGAPYSAVMLLRPGSTSEVTHFAYDAPRHLFPDRMPRPVGLLGVALGAGGPVRLDAVVGHEAGVGLPGVHPPLGPLVACPLTAGAEVLGLLAVSGPVGHPPFDELAEELVADLAAHAATAVSWARAAERERERALVDRDVLDAARHDLRTPVGAGRGFAALLRERRERLTPAQHEVALDGLVDAFDRVERFTARLLQDDRGPELQTVRVALLPLLERVADAAAGEVVLAVEGELAPTVAADEPRLQEALAVLLAGALQETGTVAMTVRQEGTSVRVDLRDEGRGLDVASQSRLFEHGRSPLAAARAVVEAHGGTLGVSSRPGEGTTSWVSIPVAP